MVSHWWSSRLSFLFRGVGGDPVELLSVGAVGAFPAGKGRVVATPVEIHHLSTRYAGVTNHSEREQGCSRLSQVYLFLYCPTGLFIGMSVLIPHACAMLLPVLLWIAYQVPFDGRHTAKSVLPSPS
jgi:hypothetical protein